MSKRDLYRGGNVRDVNPKYQPLFAAILERAELDLKQAVKCNDSTVAKSIIRFYLSAWGQEVSGNNGLLIVNRIRREIEEENAKSERVYNAAISNKFN